MYFYAMVTRANLLTDLVNIRAFCALAFMSSTFSPLIFHSTLFRWSELLQVKEPVHFNFNKVAKPISPSKVIPGFHPAFAPF